MTKFNVPAELNGYPVVRKTESANVVTVMVERANTPGLPFVVATWWPELGNTWSWGHYVERKIADTVFTEVLLRNDKR